MLSDNGHGDETARCSARRFADAPVPTVSGVSPLAADPTPFEAEPPITPGERLLFALGQLYRLWRAGELDVAPGDFDIDDLARIIGVARDIEFVTSHPHGRAYHFDSEVLTVQSAEEFPWTLLDLDTWALLAEAAERDR